MKRFKPVKHFRIPTILLDKMPNEEKPADKLKAIGTLPRELRNLHTFYNPIANKEKKEELRLKKGKWREAVRKEFHDMNSREVWDVIDRFEMPRDRRCVKSKWVLKIKRNGTYCARLVACGYSQIPGVDFNDIPYSPVINDVTYQIVLVLSLIQGYTKVIVDVKTAFLHGELEDDEEIYIECPEGMENKTGKVLRLKKTIYGLVQAAKAFYKKLSQVLKDIGFEGGLIDPCLLTRKGEQGVVYIAIYVDDCLCCGEMQEIESAIKDLK